MLTFVILSANFGNTSTANLVGGLVLPFLVFPWFFIVMVLGIGPTSNAQTESLADGILSRPVTRYEYLLAVWCSRVGVVLGVYLLTVIPSVLIITAADRNVPDDGSTKYGICAAIGIVALVLTFQVSLAFLMGTVLRKPLLSIVLLLAFWYPVNGVLAFMQQEEFSPIYLSRMIPVLMLQQWGGEDESSSDEELEAEDLIELDTPGDEDSERSGSIADPFSDEELDEDEVAGMSAAAASLMNLLGAPEESAEEEPVSPPVEEPAEVDETAPENQYFKDEDDEEEFSFLRVSLAYGLATALCLGFSTLVFCRRDV
jgi:ABC-type transport system involved in multi-copper enzyme maturation permease subunit